MKKSLLIAVAALFVALGANAQVKRLAQPVKRMAGAESSMLEQKSLKADVSLRPVFHSNMAKAPKAAAGIAGEYILNADNFEGDFTASSFFTVAEATGTITLDQYDGTPSFEYNVVLNDFTSEGAVVYGEYDETEGIIFIPVQQIAYSDKYKEIYISGGRRSGTENIGYGKSLVLVVNEDGTMDIDPDYDSTDPDDWETEGWVSFLPNYEGGGLWNYGFDIQAFAPNATMSYSTTGKGLGGTGSGWADVEKRVYVEDYGTEIVVNGFLGLAPISILINGDGTCKMPFGQEVDDYDYEEYDNTYAYGRMRLVGCFIDGNSIGRDYDKEFMNGFEDNGLYVFYKVEWKDAWDEGGKHYDEGYYYVDDDADYVRYFSVATANNPDPTDGGAYGMGWCCNMTIETDEHAATGITAPKATTDTKSTTLYDLQGRVVDGSYKGIVISNGKKMVVK